MVGGMGRPDFCKGAAKTRKPYFDTHAHRDGSTLSYHYSSSDKAEPRWSATIDEIKEVAAIFDHEHMDNVFVVRLQGGESLECAARNQNEMESWVTILSRAVNAQWLSNMKRYAYPVQPDLQSATTLWGIWTSRSLT